MSGMLGCGYNHSVAIHSSGDVYVWGSSRNNELGVPELHGFVQNVPYRFQTDIGGGYYAALEVSCGERHTAMLLRDTSLPPLKLIYNDQCPVSSIMNAIKHNIENRNENLIQLHGSRFGSQQYITETEIRAFLQEYIPPPSSEMEINLQDYMEDMVRLLMNRADQNGLLLFKEFRDQIMEVRMDDGLVITWGDNANGRLGVRDPQSYGFQIVKFPDDITITKIACGDQHTLAIAQWRKLYAWGSNSYGQLGQGNTEDVYYPVRIPIDCEYIHDIAGGGSHSMALDGDGFVYTWGLGEGGRLGHGSNNIELYPRMVQGLQGVYWIAAGHSHSGCLCEGMVYTWGKGSYGRLGHGQCVDLYQPKPIEFFEGKYMSMLRLSVFHSAILTMNGEVWAWGNSKNGRLGKTVSQSKNQLVPVRVGQGTMMTSCKIVDIALGFKHGLAIAKNGIIFSWGCGVDGKLGLDTKGQEEPLPKEIKSLTKLIKKQNDQNQKKDQIPLQSTKATDIACNDFNTIVLTDAGELFITGSNSKGQLTVPNSTFQQNESSSSSDSDEESLEPLDELYKFEKIRSKELKMLKFQRITASGEHIIALSVEGKIFSWGDNSEGQLGIGFTKLDKLNFKPTEVVSFKRVKMLDCVTGPSHTIFTNESGQLYSCGNASSGKLGLGVSVLSTNNTYQYMPRTIQNIPNVKKVSCGVDHTMAIDYSKQLWVWGGGWSGKLGTGRYEDEPEPVNVKLQNFFPQCSSTPKMVVCGAYHTLILMKSGEIYGSGQTKYCAITSVNEQDVTRFHRVNSITSEITYIAGSADHILSVTSRGQILGWGRGDKNKLGINQGQLIQGSQNVHKPTQIMMKDDIVFKKVACGSNHSAALSVDGRVFVWGAIGSGRIGLKPDEDQQDLQEDDINEEDLFESVNRPTHVTELTNIFRQNREQLESDQNQKEVAREEEDEYALQALIRNEPVENSEKNLLADDQKLVYKMQNIINGFDQIADIEHKRNDSLSLIESILMSKIENLTTLPKLNFRLTLPPLISCNIQLFEFLVAALQSHPCYLAEIIRLNPNLPAAETAETITGIFGDLSISNAKLRSLMALYKLVIQNTIFNAKDIKKSLRMKTGDLSSYLYFKVLNSQECNVRFFRALVGEIFKIIYEETRDSNDYAQKQKNIQDEEIKKVNFQTAGDSDESMDENYKRIMKIHDTPGYALDFRSLEEMDNPSPDIQRLIINRKKKFDRVGNRIIELVIGALRHLPKFRQRFTTDIRLSDEVKFMFKEIPNLFNQKFGSNMNSDQPKVLKAKIVGLFFQPLLELLKEPVNLKKFYFDEVQRSLIEAQIPGNYGFEQFIREHAVNIQCVGSFIEQVCDRSRLLNLTDEIDTIIENISHDLTDVPDFEMADLMLADLLKNSLEHQNPKVTCSVENLLQLYILLYNNIENLRNRFSLEDPVVLILQNLGDASIILQKAKEKGNHTYMINLDIPSRWLLTERAIRSCVVCQTPLTYSMLNDPNVLNKMTPLSVSTTWNCFSCGNLQDGWHMGCQECDSLRRDFPKESLFKFFVPTYSSPELYEFQEILATLPPIPTHIPLHIYLESHMNKLQSGALMHTKLVNFFKSIKEGPVASGNNAPKKNLSALDYQATYEFNNRAAHRAYLSSLFNMLHEIEEFIRLEMLQFQKNTITVLTQTAEKIKSGNVNQRFRESSKQIMHKAQGRFTITYLIRKKILHHIDLPESLQKKTMMLFTERNNGGFFIRVVLHESRDWLCVPRAPREVKLLGFDISAEKIREMRRTMNSRAQTSFEGDKITFNVFEFIGLIGQLLGRSLEKIS